MSTTSLSGRIEHLIAMAQLLERVDADPTQVGAAQYQGLVRTLQQLLAPPLPDEVLRALLVACPATAQVYENLHYDRSGLSQSPLDAAVESELAAVRLIERLNRRAPDAA